MATDPTSYCVPTGSLIAPIGTTVAIGDTVNGLGIPPGTTVVDVINQGNNLEIVLNQPPWVGNAVPSGITGDGCITAGWFSRISFSKPSITVSFREDVKGWVSFKSFVYESALSVANEYYTFDKARLFKHHIEGVDRNTFYNTFTPSSINVILNDGPGTVKSFNTLNYEGSQSKVNLNRQDDEYFNLLAKDGWHVESIETDKEKGSLNEFIEKEGKWFNYLRGQSVITNEFNQILNNKDGSSSFDQDSFAIQGIGTAIAQSVLPCPNGALKIDYVVDADSDRCDNGSVSFSASNITQSPNWRFEVEITNGPTSGSIIHQSAIQSGASGSGAVVNLAPANYAVRIVFLTEPYDSCFDPDWMQLSFTIGCTHPSWKPWDCNGASCIENTHGNGSFNTLFDCQEHCLNNPTYDCIAIGVPGNTTNTCIQNYFGNGKYPSLFACQGGCVPTPAASWNCDKDGCFDPGTGLGQYTTLNACLLDCAGIDPIVIPGCTELDACNYNPLATTDDGSCVPPYGAPAYRVVFGGEINGVANIGCTQLDSCDVWSSENIPGQLYVGPTSTSNVAQMIYECNLDNQSTYN